MEESKNLRSLTLRSKRLARRTNLLRKERSSKQMARIKRRALLHCTVTMKTFRLVWSWVWV